MQNSSQMFDGVLRQISAWFCSIYFDNALIIVSTSKFWFDGGRLNTQSVSKGGQIVVHAWPEIPWEKRLWKRKAWKTLLKALDIKPIRSFSNILLAVDRRFRSWLQIIWLQVIWKIRFLETIIKKISYYVSEVIPKVLQKYHWNIIRTRCLWIMDLRTFMAFLTIMSVKSNIYIYNQVLG